MAGARPLTSRAASWTLALLLQLCSVRLCRGCHDVGSLVLSHIRASPSHGLHHTLFEEYLLCFQMRCNDFHPLVCESSSCDSYFGMDALEDASVAAGGFQDSRWLDVGELFQGIGGHVRVAHLCPRKCQTCDSQGAQLQVAPCQRGWSHADGACFKYNHDGVFRDSKRAMVTWAEAEGFCQEEGAHLATIATPAQEHLVMQLVKQRPPEASLTGLWAWVGLQGGRIGDCSQATSWSWVGSPQAGVMDHLITGGCACFWALDSCGSFALSTNSMTYGETTTFEATDIDLKRRAWICSKPTRFHAVTNGSCQAAGLLPIVDTATCEAAAEFLLGMGRRIVRRDMDKTKPSGCHVRGRAANKVFVSEHFAGQELSIGSKVRILFCQTPTAANATTRVEAPADPPQSSGWGQPRRQEAVASFTPPVLVLVLILGLCPLLWLIVASGRDATLAFNLWDLSAIRRKLWAPYDDKKFASAIETKLQRWRDTVVKAAALLLAGFHLAELLRTSLVTEAVCTESGTMPELRELLAAVHLANVWAAVGLFAIHRCGACRGRSWPRLAFLAAVAGLELAEAALLGEQALLVESRLYRQLLWRLLFGACASPAFALAGNTLLASGMCAIYWALVPDGMIFTVGTARGGVLSQQGCNSLWDRDTANGIANAVNELAKSFDAMTGSVVLGAGDLLEETLKRRTSFVSFALSEAVLVLVVVVGLMFLHFVLHRDISQSLRLQSSAGQLSAVSRVLATLCDATFQLSSDYRVAGPAPKLDVLIHLEPTPKSMEGQDFRDIAASPEDRSRIQDALRPDALQGEAVYLDLRSAMAAVRVQLLCAEFADLAGDRRWLCGINELQRDHRVGDDNGSQVDEAIGPLPSWPQNKERQHRRAPSKGQSTPAEASEKGSLSGSDQGSQHDPSTDSEGSTSSRRNSLNSATDSRKLRLGHAAGLKDPYDGQARDVSREDFTFEVAVDSAAIRSASERCKTFLGLELKPGFNLARIAPERADFLAALRGCVGQASSSAEGASHKQKVVMVLHAFPVAAGGGRQKHPYELCCNVEVTNSDQQAPVARLHVLTVRYAKHRKRRAATPGGPAGVAPTRIGQTRLEEL